MKLPARLEILLNIWWSDPAIFYEDLYNEKPFRYQAEILREIRETSRALICAAGGTGKSKLLSCLSIFLAIVYAWKIGKPYDVIIIAGSQEQSRKLYEYSSDLLPSHNIFKEFIEGEVLRTYVKFITGSYIKALPHSLKSIQGQHSNAVIIDEAAIVDDFTLRDSYRIIAGKPNAKLIFSGTPMEYNSLFVTMWEDSKTYSEWKRYHWKAIDCPLITSEMIEEARKNLTEEQFAQFWLGEPHPITNTVVPVPLLRKQSIGYTKNPYDPENKRGKVIFGIDYGFADLTALVVVELVDGKYRVLDVQTWNRKKYENIQDWIEAFAIKYKPDYIFCDLNPKSESQRTKDRLGIKGFRVVPINMGQELPSLQVRMRSLFEHEKIIIPNEFQGLLNELRHYTWDTRKGDDRVTALMCALKEIEPSESREFTWVITKPKKPSWTIPSI